jgi:hypothetical protein
MPARPPTREHPPPRPAQPSSPASPPVGAARCRRLGTQNKRRGQLLRCKLLACAAGVAGLTARGFRRGPGPVAPPHSPLPPSFPIPLKARRQPRPASSRAGTVPSSCPLSLDVPHERRASLPCAHPSALLPSSAFWSHVAPCFSILSPDLLCSLLLCFVSFDFLHRLQLPVTGPCTNTLILFLISVRFPPCVAVSLKDSAVTASSARQTQDQVLGQG